MRVTTHLAQSLRLVLLIFIALWLAGCSSPKKLGVGLYGNHIHITPANPLRRGATENLCDILRDNPKWYAHANKSYRRWGTPVAVQMAFIYQESRFIAHASPKHSFTIFSNKTSSAYGYAQAIDSTWKAYMRQTGRLNAHRANMHDALDFIGWYNNNAMQKLGLKANQVRELYLAYHEGIKGYSMATYDNKTWLKTIATNVEKRAIRYDKQLRSCHREIIAMLK